MAAGLVQQVANAIDELPGSANSLVALPPAERNSVCGLWVSLIRKRRVDDRGKLPFADWIQALFLALLCLGTFAGGLRGGFVLDDTPAIVEHPVVQGTASPLDAFSLNFWGKSLDAMPPSYRPLATLSFALDHRLFGESALAFHLSSLLWYIGLVLVGWAFARRCMSPRAALVAMTFFVVMPVHVENVSNLVGRADTLSVLFATLALLALSPSIVDGQAATPGVWCWQGEPSWLPSCARRVWPRCR